MPRFETWIRQNTGEKSNLFQRLGKKRGPETQQPAEQPKRKPFQKLWAILKHANTPRERELAQEDSAVKRETRGLLDGLRNIVEPEKRRQIKELRETVVANPNLSKNKEAVRAYQELIKVTDPERFAREIGEVDGIYGPKTRKAYEVDKATLDNPRPAILSALSSNTPRETPTERTQRMRGGWIRNLFSFANGGSGGINQKINSIGKQYTQNGTTACSQTARENLESLGLSVPSGDADSVFGKYRSGAGGRGMLDFTSGKFNPPSGATMADIMLDTPMLDNYKRDYGHRFAAYKYNGKWYALDPYYGGTTSPIPLDSFLSRFQGRSWYSVRGAAYYNGNVA